MKDGVNLYCAESPRAREAGDDTASSVSRPTRKQSDPRSDRPARAVGGAAADGDNGWHP